MRILITLFGSLGDLFPYLALGGELRSRGHQVTIAGPSTYQAKIEQEGLRFTPLPPEFPADPAGIERMMERIFHPTRGSEILIKEFLMPALNAQFELTRAAAADADLLISHPVTFATPIVANLLHKPWIGTTLAPVMYLSVYDPPVPAPAQWMDRLRGLPPSFFRMIYRGARHQTGRWFRPIEQLRRQAGLPPGGHPLFDDMCSPLLNLAMFSAELAPPQLDWPEKTLITGFCWYDQAFELNDRQRASMERVEAFLASGPEPLIFTLGSSAVMSPGEFYGVSLRAAEKLGRRALLLAGPRADTIQTPEWAAAVSYAPHADVFPKGLINIHQGGAGTLGQAMRAGRPMLVVSHSHDQPDHGCRVQRQGFGRHLNCTKYTAASAERELRVLLEEPSYAERARAVGEKVRVEAGAKVGADAVERVIAERA